MNLSVDSQREKHGKTPLPKIEKRGKHKIMLEGATICIQMSKALNTLKFGLVVWKSREKLKR